MVMESMQIDPADCHEIQPGCAQFPPILMLATIVSK